MPGPVQFKADQLRAAMSGLSVEDVQDVQEAAPSPTKPANKRKPLNVIAMAKARLRELKAELRRMKQLEREYAELQRLLAAARPIAVVREIKRSAG